MLIAASRHERCYRAARLAHPSAQAHSARMSSSQRGGEVLYARRAALSDLVNGNAALSAELTLRIASSREALLAMTLRELRLARFKRREK